MNLDALKSALSDPALAGLTDGEVAALAGYGHPILTPRAERITYTTAGALLGAVKAIALRATLVAASATSPAAAFAHDVLSGNGFDPANADAQAIGAQFMAAGLIAAGDLAALFYTASYVAGSPVISADVAAARAGLAADAARRAIEMRVVAAYNTAMAAVQAGETDAAKIQAAFDDTFKAGG